MMKKTLALTLVLVLIFALCACGETKKDDSAVGNWTLTGLYLGDQDVSSRVSMLEIRLRFEPGGTGTLSTGEDELSITWRDNSFSDGTDTIRYTVEGDTLRFETDGISYVFTRG